MPFAQRSYGPESPRMAALLITKARLLHAEKHTKEAKDLDKRARTILAQYAKSDPSRSVVDVHALDWR
ncbi:MAG TPA: hypothetical protein VG273_19535 [Bryobacteraceae bacterium]|nr:hypothetical protein [Bryobacteraceae bacterium]